MRDMSDKKEEYRWQNEKRRCTLTMRGGVRNGKTAKAAYFTIILNVCFI